MHNPHIISTFAHVLSNSGQFFKLNFKHLSMAFRLFRASPEQVMPPGPVERKNAPPNSEIPREVWLKHLIKSYRRQLKTIDELAGYAKGLELKLDEMQQKYYTLERSYYLMESNRDFAFGYLKQVRGSEKNLMVQNNSLNKQVVKLERTKENVMKENSRIALYKSIIKSQYCHINYLHTLLHLNRIAFNKKGSYTMEKTELVDRIISECVSTKSVNPQDY